MRAGGENRLLKRSAGADRLPGKRMKPAENGAGTSNGENAEVVDDMTQGLPAAEGENGFSAGFETKASVLDFSPNRRFTGAWKPVIDGKIQFANEFQNTTGEWPSPKLHHHHQQQQQQQAGGSERPSVSNISGSSDIKKDDEGNDSDSEFRRVPEFPEKPKAHHSKSGGGSSSRRRPGASANEKEGKRLKRLLRNRVSAQQARERKKVYLIELEQKAKELESRNAELEEKNGTLQRENYMLRQIVKNTTMRGASGDPASS